MMIRFLGLFPWLVGLLLATRYVLLIDRLIGLGFFHEKTPPLMCWSVMSRPERHWLRGSVIRCVPAVESRGTVIGFQATA
jgi:hypothetical protein